MPQWCRRNKKMTSLQVVRNKICHNVSVFFVAPLVCKLWPHDKLKTINKVKARQCFSRCTTNLQPDTTLLCANDSHWKVLDRTPKHRTQRVNESQRKSLLNWNCVMQLGYANHLNLIWEIHVHKLCFCCISCLIEVLCMFFLLWQRMLQVIMFFVHLVKKQILSNHSLSSK